MREYFDITDVPMDADDVIVFCIEKFEAEKAMLSALIAREYSAYSYPDKKIVEEALEYIKQVGGFEAAAEFGLI